MNGNVTEITDDLGSLAAHYEYDPFGNTIDFSGAYCNANTFRFSTKYFDAETKLYYYGYRHYDPEVGRWLNRDPLQEIGGLNLYAFVKNNGINTLDYLGLKDYGPVGNTLKFIRDTLSNTPNIGDDSQVEQRDPMESYKEFGDALEDGLDDYEKEKLKKENEELKKENEEQEKQKNCS